MCDVREQEVHTHMTSSVNKRLMIVIGRLDIYFVYIFFSLFFLIDVYRNLQPIEDIKYTHQ